MHKKQEAEVYYKAGDFQRALQLLQELLKDDPEDVTSLYNIGMCYTELNEFDMAIDTLQKCLQLAPDHSNAYVALVLCNAYKFG